MLGWVFFLAVLGVTMAIPMKRQMINIEQLRFPSGIAAAETLRALALPRRKGHALGQGPGISGVLAAMSQFWADVPAARKLKLRARVGTVLARDLMKRLNLLILGQEWMDRTVDVRLGSDLSSPPAP